MDLYLRKYLRIIILVIFSSTVISAQYKNIKVNKAGDNDRPDEPSIAINPANPLNIVIGADINNLYYSTDGGYNWKRQAMTSQYGVWGDPCMVFDTIGNLYYGHLSNPPSPGFWIDRIVVQKSTDGGISFNSGAGIGYNPPKREQDKEWLAVDMTRSKFRNNVYTAWTEFDNYGSPYSTDSTRILFSRSTDFGENWSAPVKISDISGDCSDDDNTVEGAVPAIGPDGEVYISWGGPLGIMFDKSTDGGVSFGKDVFVASQPGGWGYDISGISRANGMPVTACDVSSSKYRGNIYISWSDQRNGVQNTDVFFIKSTDSGKTWKNMIKVNDDNSSRDQFFNWMTVDPVTGIIYVVFYDRRNTSGDATDVYMAKSSDGGDTFTNIKISESSFTPDKSVFFGDYTNITAFNGKVYPVWARSDYGVKSIMMTVFNDNTVDVKSSTTLSSFSAEGTHLKWTTSSEKNNRGFEVERKEGACFISIGFVEGKGTSAAESNYSFIDKSSKSVGNIYRLKIIDNNGTYIYSEEIDSDPALAVNGFKLLQNYPNPFNPATTIAWTQLKGGFVKLKVYDLLGKEIAELVNEYKTAGNHNIKFEAGNLTSGVYIYRLETNGCAEMKQMILIK